MTLIHTISKLKRERSLIRQFARIDEWFDRSQDLLDHCPNGSGPSARELIAHLIHSNEYMLRNLAENTNSLTVDNQPDSDDCRNDGGESCCRNRDQRIREKDQWELLRQVLRTQLGRCLYHHERQEESNVLTFSSDQLEVPTVVDVVLNNIRHHLAQLDVATRVAKKTAFQKEGVKTLFKAVGARELEDIVDSGMSAFPPRHWWQSAFYPLLSQQCACEIAEQWNMGDADSGEAGFVVAFEIPVAYFDQFEIQTIGCRHHELLVPAEQLDEFNSNILNGIRVVRAFVGRNFEVTATIRNAAPAGTKWMTKVDLPAIER